MPPVVDTQTTAAGDAAATKRLKKREIDRRCQREARQRTKSRIAYLEGLVEELRRKDTSGQVASLMQQVAEVRKERDMFARTLRGIEDSIRGHRSVLGGLPIKQEPTSPSVANGRSVNTQGRERTGNESPRSVQSVSEAAEEDVWTTVASIPWMQPGVESTNDAATIAGSGGAPTILSQEAQCDCRDPHEEEVPSVMALEPERKSIWRFAHDVLDRPPVITSKVLRWEDEHSDDIPVRAVIDGWPAVVARLGGHLPPLWAKLRQIDEVVFGNLNRVERLAILFVMHLLYRHHAEPSSTEVKQKVPAWYLPRPSQNLAHPYALDFFTWPGIRERLIFSPHSYCSNNFWLMHNAALKLVWQYDFRDCYSVNIQKGEYQISRAFEERVTDINAWTMGSDFFRRWPECYGDIPSLESIASPMSTMNPPDGERRAARRIRALKRRAKEMEEEAGGCEPAHQDRRHGGNQPVDTVASQFMPEVFPHPDSWKSPFLGRAAEDQSGFLPLSQEPYLSMPQNLHAGIWDVRTPGGTSAQDWLWPTNGLDAGLPEP